MPTIHEQLDAMLALPRGWDGYGADPVTPAAVATAKVIAGLMDPGGVPLEAHPARTGGVALMWYAGMREESIDISPAGLIEKR